MKFNYNNKTYELIFITTTGSRMYGNYTENSDWDYRGIFIESLEDKTSILNNNIEKIGGANKDGDEVCAILQDLGLKLENTNDVELYELSRFIELGLENNPNIMDLLCSNLDNATYINDKGMLLLSNKDLFLSKKLKDTFLNYSLSQLNKIKSHCKWITEFPNTHIILKHLEILYKKEIIDFDWITDNFGGQVALKITNEKAQNKISKNIEFKWNDFEKYLILENENFNPNKYRLARLIDYCHSKNVEGKKYNLDETFVDTLSNKLISTQFSENQISLKTFLIEKAAFRTLSPSMLSIFNNGKGIFTKDGNLKPNDPKEIGEFICMLSVDQMKFKSDRDYINKMWNWKCNRNEKRGELEDQYGYDLKHASHLIRLLDACKEIILTNNYVPELSGYRLDIVKSIRDGKFTYEEILQYAKEKEKGINELFLNSSLKDEPDIEKIDNILKQCYFANNEEKEINIK